MQDSDAAQSKAAALANWVLSLGFPNLFHTLEIPLHYLSSLPTTTCGRLVFQFIISIHGDIV